MDRWFEENQEIFEHPKDPYHRIDVYPSYRRVRVSLQGEVLAESSRPMALFESNLPLRWYLPPEDVRARLVPSATVTACGYKGMTSYYSVELSTGEHVPDLVWCYREPGSQGGRSLTPPSPQPVRLQAIPLLPRSLGAGRVDGGRVALAPETGRFHSPCGQSSDRI